MLKTRVIPTLLFRDFGLVKGVRFDSRRGVGAPLQAIKVYEMRGVDELVFLDVAATLAGRGPDFALVDELADDCFMPLTVGGGVRTADDIGALLRVGADKVVVNTAFVEQPAVVREGSDRYGAQCIVVSIDTRGGPDGTTVWTRCASVDTGEDPVVAATRAQELGAGEILLTSADRDGTFEGYDLATLSAVSAAVDIPVIASGGAGEPADLVAALTVGGASAVAAASIFHFTQQTPREMKEALQAAGFPVRL